VDELTDIWFASVGRNAKLLLNVPPTRAGLVHETDAARLLAFRERRDAQFAEDVAAGRPVRWRRTGGRSAEAEVTLPHAVTVRTIRLEEDIGAGQAVSRHTVLGETDGGWVPLVGGTTIGWRRLHRCDPAAVRAVRVVVEDAVAPPSPLRIGLYSAA
jgi:alpha-L-fucosidase